MSFFPRDYGYYKETDLYKAERERERDNLKTCRVNAS